MSELRAGGVVQEAGGGRVLVWVDRDLESYPKPGSRISLTEGTCSAGHGCMACSMKKALSPLARLSQEFARANARNRHVDSGTAPTLGHGMDVGIRAEAPAL